VIASSCSDDQSSVAVLLGRVDLGTARKEHLHKLDVATLGRQNQSCSLILVLHFQINALFEQLLNPGDLAGKECREQVWQVGRLQPVRPANDLMHIAQFLNCGTQ